MAGSPPRSSHALLSLDHLWTSRGLFGVRLMRVRKRKPPPMGVRGGGGNTAEVTPGPELPFYDKIIPIRAYGYTHNAPFLWSANVHHIFYYQVIDMGGHDFIIKS